MGSVDSGILTLRRHSGDGFTIIGRLDGFGQRAFVEDITISDGTVFPAGVFVAACDRGPRRTDRSAGYRRAGPRIEELRGADGHGEYPRTQATRCGRGRQGIQLPADSDMASTASHRGGDPDTQRSAG